MHAFCLYSMVRTRQHLLFEHPGISSMGSSMAITLPRDDLFSTRAGSAPAEAVLLAAFPYANLPVFAATACLGPFDLDPAAVLGRQPPGHILLQGFGLAAAFVLVVSSAVCTRQPLSASALASFSLPA